MWDVWIVEVTVDVFLNGMRSNVGGVEDEMIWIWNDDDGVSSWHGLGVVDEIIGVESEVAWTLVWMSDGCSSDGGFDGAGGVGSLCADGSGPVEGRLGAGCGGGGGGGTVGSVACGVGGGGLAGGWDGGCFGKFSWKEC